MLHLTNLYSKRKENLKKDYERKLIEFVIKFMKKFEIHALNISIVNDRNHKYNVVVTNFSENKESKSNYYI